MRSSSKLLVLLGFPSCDTSVCRYSSEQRGQIGHLSHRLRHNVGVPAHSPRDVVVVVFDGMKLLDVAGPAEVFAESNRFGASYRLVVASVDGADVTTSIGTRFAVTARIDAVEFADTAIVSGGDDLVGKPIDPELVAAVQRLRTRSRRMASICTGSFILARASLLAG